MAGLTSAGAARILDRSRQTVSRGLRQTSTTYFKYREIAKIYEAVKVENPTFAPAVLDFIQEHYQALGDRIEKPTEKQAFFDRAQHAKRIWLVLTDFQRVKDEIWPVIDGLMDRDDLMIDVFVENRISYSAFLAASKDRADQRRKKEAEKRNSRGADIDLWDPLDNILLLNRMAILDPHSPQKAAAFSWKEGAFEEMDPAYTLRIGTAFIESFIQSQPDEPISIRRLGKNDSEPVEKELAVERLAFA
ncbi:hypothetical protein [Caulobacter radicis]|uniref:hypothetical protein n=1 Tax=Caulobacter radicis TaxID=2172650 RepID=UPI000E3009DB|nr:hypothetical protein [Caulobacter radicis]